MSAARSERVWSDSVSEAPGGGPAEHPAHAQLESRVRLASGPVGASAIMTGASYAVVVDVLSFTTTLCVAAERGMTVLPYRWGSEGAREYAAEHDAVLALGRAEAREVAQRQPRPPVSLSPAHMASALPVARVVLPSPNGSAISFGLAEEGITVVGACLRNRHAVARWLQPRLGRDGIVAIIAAGEQWTDGSLRPAAEDIWGAGAVAAALAELGVSGVSGEATLAGEWFHAMEHRMVEGLSATASGQELIEKGFEDDMRVASRTDASTVVPVLDGDAFIAE